MYFDHNATTPVLPAVLDAMLPYLREHFGNPGSRHAYGRRAKLAVEQGRQQVAALVGAEAREIVFTSCGTEANNLAIRGVCTDADQGPRRQHLVISTVEHPATAASAEVLERRGWQVGRVGVDSTCRVVDVAEAVRDDTALVSIMHANNETGTLQPIAEIAAAAHARGALMHTDAAQSLGKVPVNVDVLGVDLLSLAGHKLYAPKGIGALYVRDGTPLQPVLVGGGHERGLRPGTENVAYIVALGQAAAIAGDALEVEAKRQCQLRDRLWHRLAAGVPGLRLNGHPTERLPNTLNVGFPGCVGADVLAAAPEVAASTGSACHEGTHSPSPVLTAMGQDSATALAAVRLTLGRSTTEADVDRAARALIAAVEAVA